MLLGTYQGDRVAAETAPTRMVGEGENVAYWRRSDRVLWGVLPLCPQFQFGGLFRCSKWNRSDSSAGWCSLTDCRFARAFADSVIHESPFARRSRTPCLALSLFRLISAYSIVRGHFRPMDGVWYASSIDKGPANGLR